MGLRDALVKMVDGETVEEFTQRALKAADEEGGSGRLRLELGQAMFLLEGTSSPSASLWVERGRGTSESWQRVTGLLIGDSYEELLSIIGKQLDPAAK